MNYTHLQFAYYDTFTQKQYQPAFLKSFSGLTADARVEIEVRARHFLAVARFVAGEIAKNRVAANGRVLTIFLAPEFFLRSSDGLEHGYGHYGLADVAAARALIRDAVADDDLFNDWLLVPGTAVLSEAFTVHPYWLILSDAYCVARVPLQAGTQIKEWHCVKQTFSHLDKLDNEVNAFFHNTASSSPVGIRVVNQQIMSLNGVDIGLEICLDHDNGALKTTVLGNNPPRGVDVQLLVSCGSNVDANKVAARSDGFVLRCNGNMLSPPGGKEYKVGPWPGGNPAIGKAPPLGEKKNHQRFDLQWPLQIVPNPPYPETAGYFDPLPLPPSGPPPPQT